MNNQEKRFHVTVIDVDGKEHKFPDAMFCDVGTTNAEYKLRPVGDTLLVGDTDGFSVNKAGRERGYVNNIISVTPQSTNVVEIH